MSPCRGYVSTLWLCLSFVHGDTPLKRNDVGFGIGPFNFIVKGSLICSDVCVVNGKNLNTTSAVYWILKDMNVHTELYRLSISLHVVLLDMKAYVGVWLVSVVVGRWVEGWGRGGRRTKGTQEQAAELFQAPVSSHNHPHSLRNSVYTCASA